MDTIHDEGWIKLYRKSIDSRVFQSEGLWKVWTWCLLKANHEDKWVPIKIGKGTTEVFVKRGQFVFGRKTAAKELKMPGRTVHYRMLKLATMRNLDIQTDTHYSIVTVCNYDVYQSTLLKDMIGTLTGNGQANDTNKNYKNDKKKNNGTSGKKTPDPRVKVFQEFWGEVFLQATGLRYDFSFEKDGKLIKNLLQVHDLPVLEDAARAFFKDEEAKRRGFDIGIFKLMINRLVTRKAMDPLEQARREMKQKEA